jgi:hypothetical protein
MRVDINLITITITPEEVALIASVLKDSELISYGGANRTTVLHAFEEIAKRVPSHFNIQKI